MSVAFPSPWAVRPIAAVGAPSKGLRVPFAPILLMIILAVAGLAISVIARGREEVRAAKARNELVQKQVSDLTDEIHRLGDENKAMMSNPKVIERMARERLGLIRRGEITADTRAER